MPTSHFAECFVVVFCFKYYLNRSPLIVKDDENLRADEREIFWNVKG